MVLDPSIDQLLSLFRYLIPVWNYCSSQTFVVSACLRQLPENECGLTNLKESQKIMKQRVKQVIACAATFGMLGMSGLTTLPAQARTGNSGALAVTKAHKKPVLDLVINVLGKKTGFNLVQFAKTFSQVAGAYGIPMSKKTKNLFGGLTSTDPAPYRMDGARIQHAMYVSGSAAGANIAPASFIQEEAATEEEEEAYTMVITVGTNDDDDDDDGTLDTVDTDDDSDGFEDTKEETNVVDLDTLVEGEMAGFEDKDKSVGVYIEITDGEQTHEIRLETDADSLEEQAEASARFEKYGVEVMKASFAGGTPVRTFGKLNRNDINTAVSIITTFGSPVAKMGSQAAGAAGAKNAQANLLEASNVIKIADQSGLAKEGTKLAVQILNTNDALNKYNAMKPKK